MVTLLSNPRGMTGDDRGQEEGRRGRSLSGHCSAVLLPVQSIRTREFCVHWYSSMLKHDLSLVANNPKNNIYSARIRSNLCKLPGNLTNLNDLNIVTPIKSDKISHVDKFKNFFFRQTSEIGPPK